MQIAPGERFAQYQIAERVGEGGMGVVYRAIDTLLGRQVAMKFIVHGRLPSPDLSARLRREARVLAALNHPNILTIFEIGDAEGTPFLVLEWVGGGTLAGAALPLSNEDFIRVLRPVAEALAAAHSQSIVHRDVKPGNVLLTEDGRIKLADFGLARIRDADTDATRTAGLLGTVAYMSPEQANGEDVGPPSDVFSFGVMAYELLAGQLPFSGPGPAAVLAAISAGRFRRVSELRGGIAPALADLVDRCLATDRTVRFSDGASLVKAFESIVSAERAGASNALETDRPRSAIAVRDQRIRYATTVDGCSLAYSVVGQGPAIVRVLGHFTHLEMEWEWPELRRFWEALAEQHTVVRYDGRGIGLSGPWEGEFTEETRQHDLAAVLEALDTDQVALLGISEGGWTAATYAVQNPHRVTHLVLYGAYARGVSARPGFDPEEEEALVTLVRKGWGRDTPIFRQVYTSQFFGKDADPRLVEYFNELQRVSATAETAARYLRNLHSRGDGSAIFRQVRTRTLVVHFRDDFAVSAEEGRLLASIVPGAQLVLMPHAGHYFPVDDQVLTRAARAITEFLVSS